MKKLAKDIKTEAVKAKAPRMNRVQNDLIDAEFSTPEGLTFVRYGKRGQASYKVSRDPQKDSYLIEVRQGEKYEQKWKDGWRSASQHLAYLCTKFKNAQMSEGVANV